MTYPDDYTYTCPLFIAINNGCEIGYSVIAVKNQKHITTEIHLYSDALAKLRPEHAESILTVFGPSTVTNETSRPIG